MALPHSTLQPRLSSAQDLVDETQALISLPEIYLRLRRVMDAGESSMQDVADVIKLDPALTARLLRIANSALYNFPARIETLSRAASVLGLRQIHDLVLAASVARAFRGLPNDLMDMMTFWHRSVYRAYLAQGLGAAAGVRDTESLFIRGLLLDLGHLILYHRHPEACREALASCGDDLDRLRAAERELIGCDAIGVGAQLMHAWHMPASYVAAFEHLDHPSAAGVHAKATALLHIAAELSFGLDTDRLLKEIIGRIKQEAWDLTDLWPETVNELVETAAEDVIEAMYQVFAAPD